MRHNYRERMLRITDELAAQGVGRSTSAPPYYRLAWRLGLRTRPPLYQSFAALALGMGASFAVLTGLLMWLLFRVPEGLSVTRVLGLILAAGAVFGLTMASYFRWKARTLQLPPLDG
jgi:hypothetical protein